MIALTAFLNAVRENISRITHYEKGGDGKGGGCDCIGLIIGAVRLAGGAWNGTHGSNWAARNAIVFDGVHPRGQSVSAIHNAADCFLGEIVFKAKAPGDEGYSLPEAYDDSPDQRDYYHVGVVTGIDPLCITHCTSVPGGIQVDNKQGQWRYGGKLKYVDYAAEEPMQEEPLYIAVVITPSGNTVNLRSGPSTKNKVLARVPIGAEVEVYDVLDGWSKVSWAGKNGYMMSEYLAPVELQPTEDTVSVRLDELEAALNAVDALREALQRMLREE